MAITICKDNKVEMPCNCLPPPPDKPRPIIFDAAGGFSTRTPSITFTDGLFPAGYCFLLQANGAGQLQYLGLGGGATTYLGGVFYKKTPTITINAPGGGGTTATATLILNSNRHITGLTITNPGTGYTPFQYYGYVISADPLTNKLVVIYDFDAFSGSTSLAYSPLGEINAYPPPFGWNPDINSSLKCIFKFSGSIKRSTPGQIRGRFLINGVAEPNSMIVTSSFENKLINMTHYSREITLTTTDTISYEIGTLDGSYIDSSGPLTILFHPKTL